MGFYAVDMASKCPFFVFVSAAISQIISAVPTNVSIPTTDICEWVEAMPMLYHEYHNDACPPKLNLRPNGIDCEDLILPHF